MDVLGVSVGTVLTFFFRPLWAWNPLLTAGGLLFSVAVLDGDP